MNNAIRAVLFDLDGTLADTAPDMLRTVNAMRESRRLEPVALEVVRPYVSSGARGMIGAAFGMRPEDAGYAALREEFLAVYAENLCVDTRLFPGMDELLVRLEDRGLAWGVVTNKFEHLARSVIDGLGLASRAAVMVGGDTCARAKPFPDPLLHAAQSLALQPSSILYVGDDERDVRAARAAGMPVIAAAYGYLGDGPEPSRWGADGVVGSPVEIARWAGLEAGPLRPHLQR
ncbi:MAG TPA: HAD-IA family hydrolase [Usitatibacteraceae bacterium]|nr:HAD-IA family hydrolase [Usitatibacteraceae bacterium]